jgi:hypothetical protein
METIFACVYVRKGGVGKPADQYDVQLVDDEPNLPYWILVLSQGGLGG